MTYQGNRPVAAYAMAGGTNPESLVESHVGIVRKIAWHSVSRFDGAFDVADLIQIGMIALIEAARRFEDRGIPFASYAALRIRGAMIDASREAATSSRSEMMGQRKLRSAQSELTKTLGRPPSVTELSVQMDCSIDEVYRIMSFGQRSNIAYIDDVYSDEDSAFQDCCDNPEEAVAKSSSREMLSREIAKLPQREQQILQMFFYEEMNLDEIGMCLGVSAARVCQIKKKAMDRLRMGLGDQAMSIL